MLSSQKETGGRQDNAVVNREGVCVGGGTHTAAKRAAAPPPPVSSSRQTPLCSQRVRQLLCPAEDLPQGHREGPSAPATPRTSLLILTELEPHH